MLPTELLCCLRSHLHGSTLIAACWYSLDSHVMAPVCVCARVQTAGLQPGIQEEGGHRGVQMRGSKYDYGNVSCLSKTVCVTTSLHHFLSWSPMVM